MLRRKYIIVMMLIMVIGVSVFLNWKSQQITKTKQQPINTEQQIEQKSIVTEISPPPSVISPQILTNNNCKSSVEEILKEYGDYWGNNFTLSLYLKVGATFHIETHLHSSLKPKISEYYSCISIARGKDECSKIPDPNELSDQFGNNISNCQDIFSLYSFIKYASGKDSDDKKCIEFSQKQYEISKNESSNIDSLIVKIFSPEKRKDFCKKIQKTGIENICAQYSGYLDKELMDTCKTFFPQNIQKSMSNQKVKEYFSTYMALKEKNDLYCETGNKALCLSTLTSDTSACDGIKRDVINTYCNYLSSLSQSIDIAKRLKEERLRLREEEEKALKLKIERERQKEKEEAERKKIEGEIIKKAKELLNKKKGGSDE